MSGTTAVRTASWDKPGPGTWELDSSHAGPAPGPVLRSIYEHCLNKGMTEGFALFGAPLKAMEMRWVNGKFYRRLVPLVGGGRDLPTPPAPVLWLATRLHPAFRRAEKQAADTFETKRWRQELRQWEDEWKPAIIKTNVGFAEVDLGALDDSELAEHVEALYRHVLETTTLHFRLHVSDMGPLGNLMVHLEEWGLERADTFRALGAASPATRAPALQLRALASALRAAGTDPGLISSLDEVRAASPECASLLDEYLRFHGWRLTTGYDLEDHALIELPEVLVTSIRAAGTRDTSGGAEASGDRGGDSGGDTMLAALREEVPAVHRAAFDDLVEDARLSYGLRDENGPITYEWPAGLLRRAMLEAGRRLAASGRLRREADVFELSLAEIAGVLRGAADPSLDSIAARAEERAWWSTLEAPERLGPVEADPPLSALTPNLARTTRIVLAVVSALEADASADSLTGMGIGHETYVGTARVVHDAAEALSSVEPGDVIVAPYTAPTYNAVLAIAGAVITEEGGLLCHAAVLARELGIAAVIGAGDAMSRIPDGATVEVDPVAGKVTVTAVP